MLNNKGQSLILFVIVLPILLLIVILVVDIGKALVLKQELKNISNIVLDYGLDKLDNEKLKDDLLELIKLNNSDLDNIEIKVEDEKIYLLIDEGVNGVFSNIINVSLFEINTSYVGYLDNGKKVIERISG